MRAVLAALFLGSALGGVAHAQGVFVPTHQERIVFVEGRVGPGDHQLFQRVLGSAEADLIALREVEGSLDEALQIAAEIRDRGLNTFIYGGRHCASACALMFLAGHQKYAPAGSFLGFEARNLLGSAEAAGSKVALGRVLAWLGMPADIIADMHADSRSQVYWLSKREMERLGVVTLQAGSEPPALRPPAPTRAVAQRRPRQEPEREGKAAHTPALPQSAPAPAPAAADPADIAPAAVPYFPVPDELPRSAFDMFPSLSAQ